MDRLILAFGQVRAASVLRDQELRQFTEAGIPLVEMLAEKFTELRGEMVSTADVFKLISQRAVPFEYIKEILEDPVQFDTSIDVIQRDDLDNVFNNYQDAIDDPTLTEDDMNAASIALLDGFEGRATANLSSNNPQKARAAVAVVKKIKETKKGSKKGKEMLEAAKVMAKNMKNICDHFF